MRYPASTSRTIAPPRAIDAVIAGDTAAVAPSTVALPSARMVRALAALAICLAIAWLPVQLTMPLGRDQAMIGLVAERMLEGYWPYAESWDHRGPVAYALFAAAIWICGDVPTGICVGDVAFLALAVGAMWSIGRSLAQPWIASIGAIVLVLVVRDAQAYGRPDHWLAAIWLWVLAAFMHRDWSERLATHAFAGAVIGLAFMAKPVFVILLALPLMLAIRARDPRRASATLAAFAATSGAVIAIFAVAHRLDDLIEVYITFNFVAYAGPGGDTLLVALARFLVTAIAPWFDVGAAAITITALLGARVMARQDPVRMRLLALAWAIGLGCVLLQGKSHQHHFAFANVVVAVFVAHAMSRAVHWLAAAAAADRQEFSFRLVLCGAIAIAGIALALQVHVARAANWWSAQFGLISEAAHEDSYCRPDHCHVDTRLAAEVIRRETDRSMPIFLFGTDAGLYIAADRPPATRFLSTTALIGGPPGWNARARAEAIAALRAVPPQFIVVEDFDDLRSQKRLTSRQHLESFPELRALIADRYDQSHHLGRFVLYRLKNSVMAEDRASERPAG